jgi:hypothetical protein
MIESEVLEQLNSFADNSMNAWAIYLTLTFSYLTAFYVAGAQLSKLQATIITVLYGCWSLSFALTALTHIASLENMVSEYPDFAPSTFWHLPWLHIAAFISVGGILAALYFAYDVRKNTQSV